MSISNDKWFEIWFDEGSDLLLTYLLVVIPDNSRPGLVLVCDPLENNRVVHEGQDYKETCYWLAEDEYRLVNGRVFLDDPFSPATRNDEKFKNSWFGPGVTVLEI